MYLSRSAVQQYISLPPCFLWSLSENRITYSTSEEDVCIGSLWLVMKSIFNFSKEGNIHHLDIFSAPHCQHTIFTKLREDSAMSGHQRKFKVCIFFTTFHSRVWKIPLVFTLMASLRRKISRPEKILNIRPDM